MDEPAVPTSFTACPGCGVLLPGSGAAWNPPSLASEACHSVYDEVLRFEYAHIVELGLWHQLLVDTYAAQHAGEQSAPITTAFALIGLNLALEHGRSGIEVRDAHQLLASRYREWPRFARPSGLGAMTVQDLALAATPVEHIAVLRRWARAVWDAWTPEHRRVDELVGHRVPGRHSTRRR
ncbi:MAG: DUF5946 family protein [bacterium]